ncbi:hypothetical protein DITRI_Ditri08aG0105300 [Diplodiscus trichospermus]
MGYMLAKWTILREVSVGLQTLTPLVQYLGISYATEAHGFWTLKGYVPVNAMKLTHSSDQRSEFPAIGANLGRSTINGERELETQRIVEGSFRKSKTSQVKAKVRVFMMNKMKNWRWDQDAEGNAAVFDAVLCDNVTGHEIAAWKSFDNGNYSGNGNNSFQNRYYGVNRPFTKTGGLVFAGDDYGEQVGWRLSREMEGSVLKWIIGGEVWLSYWPNNVRSF